MLHTQALKGVLLSAMMFLLLFAGGCVRSAQPILKDEQVISDDPLLGKWVGAGSNVSGELTAGDGTTYKLAYTNENGKVGHFAVRFGHIGPVLVGEVSPQPFTDDVAAEYQALLQPLHVMFVIQQTQPKLVLAGISTDWLKKYVLAHPDELEVNNPEDLIVQSSTDDFQAFFTRHYKDAGMLGDPATFVRPGDPSTQPAQAK